MDDSSCPEVMSRDPGLGGEGVSRDDSSPSGVPIPEEMRPGSEANARLAFGESGAYPRANEDSDINAQLLSKAYIEFSICRESYDVMKPRVGTRSGCVSRLIQLMGLPGRLLFLVIISRFPVNILNVVSVFRFITLLS